MRINSFNNINFRNQASPEILKQLQELGLTSTGSVEQDLKAIQEATGKQQASIGIEEKTQPRKAEPPAEMVAFMKKLGLRPTGSKQGDYNAVMEKLREMLAAAKTDEDKHEVNDLLNEFNVIIASLQEKEKSDMLSADNFKGMQQLANMNRLFML